MTIDIIVPAAGESVTEADIARWFKEDGEFVELDEPILELETDKASLTITAAQAGILKVLVEEEETVNVGDVIVKVDPRYFRQAEVETLLGDPSKAKEKLGWVPEITVEEMCAEMVQNDLDKAKQHAILKQHGYDVSVAKE